MENQKATANFKQYWAHDTGHRLDSGKTLQWEVVEEKRPGWEDTELIHLVEYSEYEKVVKERDAAYESLSGNICAYCWKKMEGEPCDTQRTPKTNQEEISRREV